MSKVAAKVRADASLVPENFRGVGSGKEAKKKKCLNFTENEFEVRVPEARICCPSSNRNFIRDVVGKVPRWQ